MTELEYWKKRCELAEEYLFCYKFGGFGHDEGVIRYKKWREFANIKPYKVEPLMCFDEVIEEACDLIEEAIDDIDRQQNI